MKYSRILLKLSGQAFMGSKEAPFDTATIMQFAKEIKAIYNLGITVAVVIGGGNIYRGLDEKESGIERVQGDYMGMLATVINALALQSSIEKLDIPTRVMSGLTVTRVSETYIRRRAIRHLEKRRIVIFSGGTTNPYFSTDSAAALRALEINADVLLKGTRVDGVYDQDPNINPKAKRFDTISFNEVISKNLSVMDKTAFTMCQENELPIVVFNIFEKDALLRIAKGQDLGTMIS